MRTAEEHAIDEGTRRIQRIYDRAALWYDLQEWLPERLAFRRWRQLLWDLVPGGNVLEVGVGTGKNLPYYRKEHRVTAVDFSPKMLRKARARAQRDGVGVALELMDVQALGYADSTFDSAVSTFVFCSVPDAVRGLEEVRRVLKPGGRAYLLEHVLSQRPLLRWIMRGINGVWRAASGANIDRDTVGNAERAGLEVIEVRDLWRDIVKLIIAGKAA